jgi:hypothetical protein
MASVCEIWGLRIEYPENWTLDAPDESPAREADDDAQYRDEAVWSGDDPSAAPPVQQVVISGPGTAFWQLSRHPLDASQERLFDEALSALRAEYREIEVEPLREQIADLDWAGYDVNFYCLDLTVTVEMRALRTPDALLIMLCQAEDREWRLAGLVFRAMNTSMVRSLKREN